MSVPLLSKCATRQEQTSLADTPTETSTDHTALKSDAVVDEKPSALTHQGRLLLDATVAEQAIRFPTDLSLLNESNDLEAQVEAYHRRYGFYPETVVADPVYGTKKNRAYLKDKGIRYAGKALGRPKKVTEQNREQLKRDKQQRQADYRQRIPIEGKFGQGKRAYGLNLIQAKTARTSEAWINSIFLVMNLLVLLRHFFVPAIIQRCTNKFFEFFSKIITMNMTSPSKLITNGYANRWLLSF